MPKIDYSKTIIYHLRCKTENVCDGFFGHTTDMYKMRHYYKRNSNNGKDGEIYDVIRNNGGFGNWELLEFEKFPECSSKKQADQRVDECKKRFIEEKVPQKSLIFPHTLFEGGFEAPHRSLIFPQNLLYLPHFPSKSSISCGKETENKKHFVCKQCKHSFSRKDNLIRHHKTCCKTSVGNDECSELKKTIEEQQRIIETLTNNKSSVNLTQNNINNTQHNTFIIELGKENLADFLSVRQQKQILGKKYDCLDYLIEKIHCNPKFPQFQCITIPSLTKSHCNVYSEKHGKFIANNTNYIVEKIVDYRMEDIQSFYEKVQESKNQLCQSTETAVKQFIEKMENDPKYKKTKCNSIKMNIHNHLHKQPVNLLEVGTSSVSVQEVV